MKNRYFTSLEAHIDWTLFIYITLISTIGIFVLYSTKQDIAVVNKQLFRLGLATLFMLFIAHIPPRIIRMLAPALYTLGITLLLIVLIVGHISKGGQRWLDLWIVRFQPAELMKLAVPLMIARYFDQRILPPTLQSLCIPFLLIAIPVILVAKQPDLGTALLIFSAGALVIFFTGVPAKLMAGLIGFIAACSPILWFCMRDYQRQRVLTLLDPAQDPLGKSYQIIQSKIAIGSGGLYGKGWLNGSQAQLEFLPERTTDSIFAVFGEEFGLVGCLILLALYLCIIIRGLYIGVQAQDTFSRLLAGSLTMTFFVYVFVNIAMVTGIVPVVGIPLPLISYGGTSLVTLLASMGILMSIQTHRTLLAR